MRAISLGVDAAACREELERALVTTQREVTRAERLNFSLCHGRFGNAESLLIAAERLGGADVDQLSAFAAAAVQEAESDGHGWLTGAVGGGEDASLMLGEAGIGHFLLRLARPEVPSVLCLSSWVAVGECATVTSGAHGDEALRAAETAALLGRVFAAARYVSDPEALEARIASACRSAPAVGGAIESVSAVVGATEPDPATERLREALHLDLVQLAAECEFDDYVTQLYRDLQRPDPGSVRWDETRVVLAPSTRIVYTNWAWSDSPTPVDREPPAHPSAVILYRAGRRIAVRAVTTGVAQVLETLSHPLTIAEATVLIRAALEDPAVADAALPDAIRRAIHTAYSQGMLDVVASASAG